MYNSKIKSESIDNLFNAILTLQTSDECYRFFEDLCTISEMQSLAQRFEISVMLDSGLTYHEIAHKTGASTATISRINRCLEYGADGYKTVLERVKK